MAPLCSWDSQAHQCQLQWRSQSTWGQPCPQFKHVLLNACFENKTGCKERYLRALLHLRNNINISY